LRKDADIKDRQIAIFLCKKDRYLAIFLKLSYFTLYDRDKVLQGDFVPLVLETSP